MHYFLCKHKDAYSYCTKQTLLHFISKLNSLHLLGKSIIGHCFIEQLSKSIEHIDFHYVLAANRIDSKTSMEDVISFALENLSHTSHSVRMSCMCIIKKLSKGLIAKDLETLNKQQQAETEISDTDSNRQFEWHLLNKFKKTIIAHTDTMKEYSNQFW